MYFGNFVTTEATLLLVASLVYIVYTVRKQADITCWGRKVALLAITGLLVCCFVAVRDEYHLSVQASMDGSITPGLFTIDSIQSTICCIGGMVIAFASLSSVFIRNQKYRKMMFLVISVMMVMKTLVIEISRWTI